MDRVEIHRDSQLGLEPYYFHEGGSTHGSTIAGVLASNPSLRPRPDREGVRQCFARRPDGHRTCFQGIRKVPLMSRLRQEGGSLTLTTGEFQKSSRAVEHVSHLAQTLGPMLEDALKGMLAKSRRPALALSGGLDSAYLLALCLRLKPDITVVTLTTSLDGYCEKEAALVTAESLGCANILTIKATADDFVEALPAAIAAAETPLYNLHPVSKWLIARELRHRHFDTVITGDGADQVLTGAESRNYLPVVGAITRAAGINLACPFLDARVLYIGENCGADPDKAVLRLLAADLLPPEIAYAPKQPRLAPDFDLSAYRASAADAQLSRLLDETPPSSAPSPESTLWATATLLYQQIGGFD